jgi:hypothetical protein
MMFHYFRLWHIQAMPSAALDGRLALKTRL